MRQNEVIQPVMPTCAFILSEAVPQRAFIKSMKSSNAVTLSV